jgi:hypothetical protein
MDKQKLKIASGTAFKETFKEVLKLVSILLIIGIILFFTVSNISNIFTSYRLMNLTYIIIGFIILRYAYLIYDLYIHLIEVEKIRGLPFEPTGEKTIVSSLNRAKIISDRFKVKIDIYKSFSPLPIIVFLITILVNNENFKSFQKVEQYISNFNVSNSLRFVYVILAVSIIVIYYMALINNYYKYKNVQQYFGIYQETYDEINYRLEKEKLDREIKKHDLDIKKLELDIKKLKSE